MISPSFSKWIDISFRGRTGENVFYDRGMSLVFHTLVELHVFTLLRMLEIIMKNWRAKVNTPPIAEIIWVKNVRAIVVCGFLMKSLKNHILKI